MIKILKVVQKMFLMAQKERPDALFAMQKKTFTKYGVWKEFFLNSSLTCFFLLKFVFVEVFHYIFRNSTL